MNSNSFKLIRNFAKIKNKIIQDGQTIQAKTTQHNHIINQLFEIIKMLVIKHQNTFETFRNVAEKLIKKIQKYYPKDQTVNTARLLFQEEQAEWTFLQAQVNQKCLKLVGRQERYAESQKNVYKRSQALCNLSLQDEMDLDFTQIDIQESTNIKIQKLSSVKSQKNSNYKMDLQVEHFKIKEFAQQMLAPMMEQSRDYVLPKKVVLNLYINYNKQIRRELKIENTGQIQMQLTNQIKACFPNIISLKDKFKGLKFKNQHEKNKQLTDRISGSFSANEQNFKKNYIDPVDLLLRQHGESNIDGLYDQEELKKILKFKNQEQ